MVEKKPNRVYNSDIYEMLEGHDDWWWRNHETREWETSDDAPEEIKEYFRNKNESDKITKKFFEEFREKYPDGMVIPAGHKKMTNKIK